MESISNTLNQKTLASQPQTEIKQLVKDISTKDITDAITLQYQSYMSNSQKRTLLMNISLLLQLKPDLVTFPAFYKFIGKISFEFIMKEDLALRKGFAMVNRKLIPASKGKLIRLSSLT